MRIELVGLELHGYHGALESERRDGQRFLFDLELELRDERAALSDRLSDAVDYREAVAIVREISDARAYFLLEALAGALADALVERLPVASVRVRVRKPDVVLEVPVTHTAVVAERRAGSGPHDSGEERTDIR